METTYPATEIERIIKAMRKNKVSMLRVGDLQIQMQEDAVNEADNGAKPAVGRRSQSLLPQYNYNTPSVVTSGYLSVGETMPLPPPATHTATAHHRHKPALDKIKRIAEQTKAWAELTPQDLLQEDEAANG